MTAKLRRGGKFSNDECLLVDAVVGGTTTVTSQAELLLDIQ